MQQSNDSDRLDDMKDLRVALVDDFLTVDGGAQRVLRILHDIFPDAPVHAVTYFPEKFDPPLSDWDIRTSFVAKLPFSRALEQQYKLFYPMAIESLDFSGFDLVISSTYAGYSKAVIVPPDTVHLSYVHTVPRFLWGFRTSRHERVNWLYRKLILPPLEHYWRIWDRQTSVRPDAFIANSENIARRVRKFYRREADVIHPPVEIAPLLELDVRKKDHYIYFGRLEKYKCVDMAIRACVTAGEKLRIIGSGSYEDELKELVRELDAEDTVKFTGWISRGEIGNEIAQAKGFIFPGPDEDFGMVMVESLAAGTPVIAFERGGAAEILVDGETGIVIGDFSQEALDDAVRTFDPDRYSSDICRNRSKDFGEDVFRRKFVNFVRENV